MTYIHTPLSDLLAGVEPEQVTRDNSSNLEEEFVIVNEGLWWINQYSFIKKKVIGSVDQTKGRSSAPMCKVSAISFMAKFY